jgi:hypothetical protein
MITACSTALKEWAVICRALETGKQSLLLRKGGIAEGPGGFYPEHGFFWLYPTQFHQGAEQLAPSFTPLLNEIQEMRTADSQTVIRTFAVVEQVEYLTSIQQALSLNGLHGWTDAVVRQRFDYKRPGLFLFVLRVFRTAESVVVTETVAMAGCKSWVELPAPISFDHLPPVLTDAAHDQATAEIRRRLAR